MESKDSLTNEIISKRFENQFDLVNYAIGIAQEMIHSGRGPRVKTDTENPALQVIEEIIAGKDIFEDEESSGKDQSREETPENSDEEDKNTQKSSDASNKKNTEKKKVLTE